MWLKALSTKLPDMGILRTEYKKGIEIGPVRLGDLCLYIKSGLRVCYLPYEEICRCFRRVMVMRAKVRGESREIPVEYLVICTDAGEIVQVQLPGKTAAKQMMSILKKKVPGAEFASPAKAE
ncbi:MAG: hypothetical protein IJ036_04940 [Lachnospiraceae bacterium]|nr:hypothetical protein [Lachnospiraceae bacterium]